MRLRIEKSKAIYYIVIPSYPAETTSICKAKVMRSLNNIFALAKSWLWMNGDGVEDLCDSEQESSTMKTMVVRNQRECGRNPEYYFSSLFRWSRLPMTSPSPMITALSPVSTPLSANQSARSDSGRPEQRPKWLPAGQTPARRSISTARR